MGSGERGDSGLKGLGSLCAWIVGMLLHGGCTGPEDCSMSERCRKSEDNRTY